MNSKARRSAYVKAGADFVRQFLWFCKDNEAWRLPGLIEAARRTAERRAAWEEALGQGGDVLPDEHTGE
jgi:hypothetical protein